MKKAFTILELLVVISVFSIIIAIGIPRIKGFMDNAKNAQARKELQTMQAALESYYTFSTPKALPPTTTTVAASYLISAAPNVINTVFKDPLSNPSAEYNYLRSSNGKYYVIYSAGYNGSSSGVSINNAGMVNGLDTDDLCSTNGNGCEPGALRCGSGLYNCSGSCVDLQSNPNCGACGVTCGGGTGCACGGCYLPGLEPC